jgi:hypothetical protein
MRVSGYAPAGLYPEEGPRTRWARDWVGREPVWTQRLQEKFCCLCRGSNLDRSVVQSVVRHYSLSDSDVVIRLFFKLHSLSVCRRVSFVIFSHIST